MATVTAILYVVCRQVYGLSPYQIPRARLSSSLITVTIRK